MAERLQKPTNPYDPAWVEYARQNPGLRRSLSAADASDDDTLAAGSGADTLAAGGASDTIDLGAFVPEAFHGEDGAFDTEGFRSSYDELVTFKAQADEAKAALPQSADDYQPVLPEDFQLLEGFDPDSMAHFDDDGNKVEFDPAAMIDKDDPDLKSIQSLMFEAGVPQDVMSKLMGIVVNRELRGVLDAQKEAEQQTKALGPESKSRIDTMTRTLKSRLPAGQANALLDSIVSADVLRGLEALIKAAPRNANPAPNNVNYADMSPKERIMAGLSARSKQA